jgi:hypothetical protein
MSTHQQPSGAIADESSKPSKRKAGESDEPPQPKRGRPVSGRVWKQPRLRRSSAVMVHPSKDAFRPEAQNAGVSECACRWKREAAETEACPPVIARRVLRERFATAAVFFNRSAKTTSKRRAALPPPVARVQPEQKVLTAFERREQEKLKRQQAKELEEVRARCRPQYRGGVVPPHCTDSRQSQTTSPSRVCACPTSC